MELAYQHYHIFGYKYRTCSFHSLIFLKFTMNTTEAHSIKNNLKYWL